MKQEAIELALTTIVENIKFQRKSQGFSQLKLALAMEHKSVGLVSFVEAGINNQRFNLEHIIRIANILNVPICTLFQGVDEILLNNQDN